MNKGPCFVCGMEAILQTIKADKYSVRCERCGKHTFLDGLNENDYKGLPEEQREKIVKHEADFHSESTAPFSRKAISPAADRFARKTRLIRGHACRPP
jgi:hypothetical protein